VVATRSVRCAAGPPAPDVRGEYDVERELGRGGMAAVFKATEIPLERTVALRCCFPSSVSRARRAARFRRKHRSWPASTPHIVQVYRVGQVGGSSTRDAIVEGRSLHSILETQALPLPVILAVLRGATRGLSFPTKRRRASGREGREHPGGRRCRVVLSASAWRCAPRMSPSGRGHRDRYAVLHESGAMRRPPGQTQSDQYALAFSRS